VECFREADPAVPVTASNRPNPSGSMEWEVPDPRLLNPDRGFLENALANSLVERNDCWYETEGSTQCSIYTTPPRIVQGLRR
jgi:hypothetical protein